MVRGKLKPHKSHKMSKWRSGIVCFACTERFGNYRTCTKCGGEQMQAVQGEKMTSELYGKCDG